MPSHPADDDPPPPALSIHVHPSTDGVHRLRFHPAGGTHPVDVIGSPAQLSQLVAAALHTYLPAGAQGA